jgi:thiol-disulfide isomerase/thioredoxin/uncharacterized membrane protein YphA (DoxX/SURF4 family)
MQYVLAAAGLGVARTGLAVVFLIASVAKLVNNREARQTLVGFGVPSWFVAPLSWGLPLLETALATALLIDISARWGAAGALTLLAVFTVVIARALRKGVTPPCRCFGQLSRSVTGWRTLARNVILLVIAAMLVGFGPGVDWLLPLLSSSSDAVPPQQIIELLAIAVCALMLFQLIRQQGRVLTRLESMQAYLVPSPENDDQSIALTRGNAPYPPLDLGVPIATGSDAPKFWTNNILGARVGLEGLLDRGRDVVLLFQHTQCGPCIALAPEIADWQRKWAEQFDIVVLLDGKVDSTHIGSLDPEYLWKDEGASIAASYGVYGTPSAVIVRHDGKLSSRPQGGADKIRALIAMVGFGDAKVNALSV